MGMFASEVRAQGDEDGLYRSAYEHDACGVGFVADVSGNAGRRALVAALRALDHLVHRGAIGADARTSDGAGMLTQVPNRFLCGVLPELTGQPVPPLGDLAAGNLFIQGDAATVARCRALLAAALAGQGLALLAWRDVPIRPEVLVDEARASLPTIAQAIVARPGAVPVEEFERLLLLARRAAERAALAEGIDLYFCSLSARTISYKGLLVGGDMAAFYPDLADERYETALALFHQRYSTNTAPTWTLSQPFRLLAHNGEINTVQGNRHWVAARERGLRGGAWGDRVPQLAPIVQEGGSDSASLDNLLEVLTRAGHSPVEALAILVGEGWEGRDDLDPARRAFYEYHAPLLEPWDGPAALAVTDGVVIGAALDRNGLRPARYRLTADGLLVVASEVGVLEPAGDEVAVVEESGRLGPGQMIAVDLAKGRMLRHDDIIGELAARHPYEEWVQARQIEAEAGWTDGQPNELSAATIADLQRRYGYSFEDLRFVLSPMAAEGHEAVWSMGDDAPLAILSDKPRPLADFFRQRFAQVTNPPIDPIRERAVMALDTYLGPRAGLLADGPAPGTLLHLKSPVIGELRIAGAPAEAGRGLRIAILGAFFNGGQSDGLATALARLQAEALRAVEEGAAILIVTDRWPQSAIRNPQSAIPSLLAVAAVHQALIRAGRRLDAEIVAEAGDAWSTHHIATLIAYGAAAVHPWLALASARALAAEGEGLTAEEAARRYIAAIDEGLLKLMSKMGISTVRSYHGSGLFEALGLANGLVEAYFPGTPSPIGGIGLAEIAADVIAREAAADEAAAATAASGKMVALPDHGFIRYRRDGERHAFTPHNVKALQKLVGAQDGAFAEAAARYEELTATNPDEPLALRDLLALVPAGDPLPLAAVEGVESIRRRFIATAMSLGALSPEAFTTLAAGMDKMGARSNSGEGGEDPDWYRPQPDGLQRHSKIKQVASARFGVTAEYLIHAEELEIKMAQGSKPGEGGQLPGHKVTPFIARLRHAVPGTQLISPPPHHDIYSIEDLAQLIYDLRAVNPAARIGVKLVATGGVGTIAAGVAKAGADYVLVSGHNGGTGASPLSSIKGAGLPWELGVAEAQQTLIRNGLRDRVRLRTDGGLRTGRDVVIAAALGAEEYGFGTSALVAIGCDMARQCHLNTCPAGIATQREDLRAKFTGTAEGVVTYFTWLAEQVRVELAALGLATLDEAVGRVELLQPVERTGRLATIDFTALLAPPPAGKATRFDPAWRREKHHTPLADYLLDRAGLALRGIGAMKIPASIRNRDRASGGELAGEIARRRAAAERGGMPPAPIYVRLTGSAGQSFGAFCVDGLTLRLRGEANDYVGKGMSGGMIVIQPSPGFATAEAPLGSRPVLIGNTVLYGATGGELYVGGAAGERFAVRNSGATAVVEGVGDHGCEYMTGGTVLVLGATGRNFAAGMTAGRAFVLDEDGAFRSRCNRDTVLLTRVARNSEEAATIRRLLERHAELTGSARAKAILAAWDYYALPFWAVTGKPPVVAAPATQARPARPQRPPVVVRRAHEAAGSLVPTGTGGGDD